MADSITDQVKLIAAEFVTRSEIDSLTTYERRVDQWEAVHKRAWIEVKKDIAKRRKPLEESDLTDSSELEDATLMKVLEIAYRTSDVEGMDLKKHKWRARYRREMNEVQLTVNTVEETREGQRTVVYRG